MKQEFYELTNPQKPIWLTEQYFTETAVNTICGYTFITDKVHLETLKKAIYEMIKCNDGMRIKIDVQNDMPFQYVSDFELFDMPTVELRSQEELEQKALEMANTPFMKPNEFLFQFLLFKLPNGSGGFIVNVHHLIGDSWSLGLIAKEVTTIYSELLAGTYEEKSYPSYIDYIDAEQTYKTSDKYEKDKLYWEEVFHTIPEIASLKSIQETQKEISCQGKRQKFTLDNHILNNIKAFCDTYKISVYTFFMAVYSLYLSRVSHLTDFVIGTPILNRTNFDQKHTMGMFISVAPLRVNVQEENTFLDFAKEVGTNIMSVFRHQKYSYQTILEDIRKKNSAFPSLYNILLSYQITKTTEESNGVHYVTDWVFNGNSSDELQVHLFDLNEQAMTVAYDYKASLFSEEEIANLHHRILTIVEQIIAKEAVCLKEIEVVTPEEKKKLLSDFNNTSMPYSHQKTVIDLFQEQVEKTPNHVAVIFENQKLTYQELNERANQVAHYLSQNGVKPNDIVGIMLYRCPEMLIGILATLKLGATYLPIDPNYPTSRINYMLSDSNAKTVLVHSATMNLDIGTTCRKIEIDTDFSQFSCENMNQSTPDGLIYLIYTSGSTGNPKGVMITHQNIVNFILGEKQHISFDSNKVMVSVTTICFDIFALELWGALTSGIPLVLANDTEQVTPIKLKELCSKHHVTMMQTTPSRYSTLLADIQEHDEFWSQFTDIMVGGEPFPKALLEKLQSLTKATIFNMYGPTETTVWSTIKNLSNCSEITIGKPIANTTCYILDSHKNLLPIGVPGELYIGGDGVANGYWNREELTKEKFITSPFSDEIIYGTGDLAYFDYSGELVHLGRNDSQIKIRGYRIELEEIENRILEYPSISHCLVNPVNSSTKLCAYYISQQEVDLSSLKSMLSSVLPNYMVPNYFVKLDAFPYTPNGKIDRKNLPAPKIEVSKNVVTARNEMDTTLMNLLKDLLKLEVVDIETSIYDLGGDSLTSIGLATEIYHQLGISITVNDIFKHPTIKELSDYIATLSQKNIAIPKAEKRKYYPASHAQQRMYYASSVNMDSTLYNIAGGIILNQSLDIALLKQCFQTLLDRNEGLRTHFEIVENQLVQVIEDKIDFTLCVNNEASQDLEQIYHDFVTPFDLSKAPLFRAKVATLKNHQMLLLLDMHHIISDGTSLNILLQELCDLYNGKVLPEKQVDYKDFTLWEKEQFEKEDFKHAKDFWVHQYQDEIPVLNMPTTYPRPSVQSFEGANYHTKLSKETFEKINSVAKTLGITPYMLLLASYYILLANYTSQNDIVVGTPIVGRELPELSSMVGMFVNTLALRSMVSFSESFKEFATSLKEYCLEAFQNQSYPFDELVKELSIKRNAGRNPLFDVMFAYQNNGYPTIDFNNTQVEYFIPDNAISKFDLTLEITPMNDELLLRFEYCTKLFDKAFIERLSNHYINILHAILENVDCKIADIPMLSEEEQHQILFDFNNTYVDYPRDKTIVDLFEEQVKKVPNQVAVVFEKEQLTYQELNEKANQLARVLVEQNVKTGDIVAIYLNKSLEVIVSMLAILKAGAAFLPLDIDYPEDRLSYVIHNSNPKIILSSKSLVFPFSEMPILLVDLTQDFYQTQSTKNLQTTLTPEDLMYVMYTSGSTGNPKGVMVKHKNIIRLAGFPNFIEFAEQEVMVQTGTIVFDACIFEIFGSLLHGFKLYILKKEHILDIPYFTDFLEKEKVTILFLTTGLFNHLGLQSPSMFKHLKYLLTGGDVISKESIQKILACSPSVKIINCYGPTENGSYSTCYPISGKESIIPIGKPITNSTAYVVANNKLCPIGVPGELWVGGDGLARGYLNQDELTKEQFIANPFGDGLLYKTGDLVKWLPDGNLEFMGRIDNQVKIRGFRIELSEIDRKILLPENQIKQSLTVIHNINHTKTICSYIVSDSKIDMKALKANLEKVLPTYMIPTFITQLESFPLTISGKIDVKAFPIPNVSDMQKEIVAARNELDTVIIDILSHVLDIPNISITDSFFDLGGDSLSAISFTNSLTQKLNIAVHVGDIFMHPTVKELSDYLATMSIKNNSTTIQKVQKSEYYPVSSAQRRIYYASSADSNSIVYNIAGGIIVDKPLDIALLQKCFQELIDRNEALRTHFDLVNEDIVQIVENKVDFTLSTTKDSSGDLNQIYTDFVKPFDLSKAPLFRAKVVSLQNNKMLLLLDMHHLIGDGTSLSVLLQEFCDLYRGKSLGEKQIDYKDFTLWEKEQVESDEFKNAKEFWVNQYQDEIPLLNMPTTYPRPSTQSFEGANYHTKLSKETAEKIDYVAKKLGITPYMFLLASYYILLAKYTSQNDIVVGTPIVGRELPELSDMIGMFVNTLALRKKVDLAESFKDFATSLKDYCLSAFQYQTYPFNELVSALNIKKDMSRSALFDTMFIYQNNGYPTIDFGDVNAQYFIPDSPISKFDLSLEIVPVDDELTLRFEYCTKLFDSAFIERLACHYQNILNAILENENVKIADIDMLSEEEKRQILYDFNHIQVDYPHKKTLVNLFKEQVNRTPNMVAVSNTINEITYRELDMKSNYLASLLSSQGVKCGDVVGVCLNRSIELLISIWAILKLGAAYMPMYIGYPIDRLKYMLSNSNAKMLITNSHLCTLFDDMPQIVVDQFTTMDSLEHFTGNKFSSGCDAYVIYTSGSTGKPKGVKISHQNLINFIYNFNSFYQQIDENDTFLASTNISFDVSIWELFLPLLNGAKLILNKEELLNNIIDYCDLILSEEITALYIPPNILNEVFEVLKNSSNIKINKLLVGVEAIKKETLNKFFSFNENMIIVNGYGPTETTVCATAFIYQKDLNDVNSVVSIGHPLGNNKIYILNPSLQLQPLGIPGEIYISGAGVGNGYINNVEANQKSFITIDGHRLYKTGDLAKWSTDGTIDFVGRMDNQVKLNGYRIELNEITAVAMTYPNINKCYTTIVKNENTSYLISYFTSDSNIAIKDLRAYLQSKLTFYMVPRFLMQVEAFPMTENGKINYKSLPMPDFESNIPLVAPRDDFEKKIATILCNLLNLKQISIDENFFDIGCDSIIAIKFQIEALKENISISYGDIFQYPTIRMLSDNKNSLKNHSSFDLEHDYDYTSIHHTLMKNKTYNPTHCKKAHKNTALLLGSTGFLGAHLLDSYFSSNPDHVLYCIVRRKSLMDPSERLKKTLNYYFGNKYDNYFLENKIVVIEGDICEKYFGLSIEQLNDLMDNIDIVINSAALVKHYGDYETFSKINIDGTKFIIDICKEFHKKLYHISTLSVSGLESPDAEDSNSQKCIFDECSLYIHQNLNNIYIYTKFEAEKRILEELVNGLDATILRVGNLTNRFSDGFFQINVSENAFVNKLQSIINLKAIPSSFLEHAIEFTPVDLCANAIIKIVNTEHPFSVLHIFNTKFISCQRLLEYINHFGYCLQAIPDHVFTARITQYLNTDSLKNSISGIVTDLGPDKTLNYVSNIELNANITNSFLNALQFEWPILGESYFAKYFEFFKKLDYFIPNKEDSI